ncbi:DUF732 domain-containing protein [Mycobacterium simiae]|uniref:DUF732 domain-containing protein n=1 Tax=Mycobacterium simiae TaxID=1784 RepID=A0A5B1BJK3_MYCSI|nr:DUF732 domain-containing protein [Mycobacterium simiae]KAA1248556.1 DUF732 domain-containing protein [Mycobacterium simiae]
MKLVLTLAGVAAMIAMAAPTYADTSDDAFLVTLQRAGITYPDPARAVAAGRWVCEQVASGMQMVDVVNEVQRSNVGLRGDNAARFTAIAANAYCPKALFGDTRTGSRG